MPGRMETSRSAPTCTGQAHCATQILFLTLVFSETLSLSLLFSVSDTLSRLISLSFSPSISLSLYIYISLFLCFSDSLSLFLFSLTLHLSLLLSDSRSLSCVPAPRALQRAGALARPLRRRRQTKAGTRRCPCRRADCALAAERHLHRPAKRMGSRLNQVAVDQPETKHRAPKHSVSSANVEWPRICAAVSWLCT
jgi:hypothetical protein